jgi:hypothetical protein
VQIEISPLQKTKGGKNKYFDFKQLRMRTRDILDFNVRLGVILEKKKSPGPNNKQGAGER